MSKPKLLQLGDIVVCGMGYMVVVLGPGRKGYKVAQVKTAVSLPGSS